MPIKYSRFWNSSLLQPMNKMDYFSYLKVFPVAFTPGQHGWIFFQTGPQLVYIIASLTAPEESVCTQMSHPKNLSGVGWEIFSCVIRS